jgi:hypothetical protein
MKMITNFSKFFFCAALFLCSALLNEGFAQTIKGSILDHNSQSGIIGATVTIQNSEPLKGSVTDLDGNFLLENCPLGQHVISISYVGYKAETVEVLVSAGKEAIVQITLEEDQEILQSVVIVAQKKTSTVNKLAKISANTMAMQTVSRISGGRGDVARFTSSFAGVAPSSDGRNDITVRGNNSNGILWRLEGMPIANPNHFASFGSTSGAFSALNSNMLAQSDFLTGAFPAEYGNGLSGVLDLQLKVGNKEKHEVTTQIGAWSGVEIQTEGPLLKRLNGSYALAYRYSFVDIMRRIGYNPTGDASPQYSDLCYNFDFHKKKQHFNFFGIAGIANMTYANSKTAGKTQGRPTNEYMNYKSKILQVGLRYQYLINETSYWKNTLYYGKNNMEIESGMDKGEATEFLTSQSFNDENSWRFSSQFNKRFSKQLNFRAGIISQQTKYTNYFKSIINRKEWYTYRDLSADLWMHEAYAQIQYKVKKRYSLNLGVHSQYSPYTKHSILEPRAALKIKLPQKNDLVLAYGLHSQLPILNVLFYADAKGNFSNKNLDFLRSHHFVIGWDKKLANDWNVHAETYFQYLTHVPIQKNTPSFSILNFGSESYRTNYDSLVNNGLGRNHGIELSLSRSYKNGFYCTVNTSFFQSKYKTSDDIWRNTAFNNRFIISALAGKEFSLTKSSVITVDSKISTMGGNFYTPIDLAKSKAATREIRDDAAAFSATVPTVFQFDLRIGFRIDGKHRTQTFYLDLSNLTNRENISGYYYDRISQSILARYNNLGILPDFMYKLQF